MYLDLDHSPPIVRLPPERDDWSDPRRWIILPCIRHVMINDYEKIIHDNFVTIVYIHMNRVFGSILDSSSKWEYARSDSAQYKLWLLGYRLKDGIPPHICFGGGVKTIPGGDPTFYNRWVEYVHREILA